MALSASPQHPSRDKAPSAVNPYGLWPSPINAEQVARQATAYDAVHTSGEAVYWLETRPSEDGRAVVVRWTDDTGAADAVPAGFDVGSRVHEYGGGAYLPAGRTLFACSQNDQRLYRIEGQHDPVPITPEPPAPTSLRYADLRLVPSGALLVCVRERHQDGQVVNELVALPVDGSADPWVVASGHDFYAAPRPSPDGRRLAWLTWDRPCMPWDGADLWVADLGPEVRLGPARHVAGGPQESVVQPDWSAEGILHFVSDRSGWWNLYRERHGQVEPLLPMAAEFADAPWELDYSSYASVGNGAIACGYRQHGRDRLALLHPETGRLTDLPIPYTSVKPYLRAVGDRLAFIGASPRPARPWRSCMCLLGTWTSWLGPRFPWIRPGSRGPSRSSFHPGTARRPTPSITGRQTLKSPGQQMLGRRYWCRPILGRPPTPRPALTSASSSSPAEGSP
jgi:hypothetical protein